MRKVVNSYIYGIIYSTFILLFLCNKIELKTN